MERMIKFVLLGYALSLLAGCAQLPQLPVRGRRGVPTVSSEDRQGG